MLVLQELVLLLWDSPQNPVGGNCQPAKPGWWNLLVICLLLLQFA